MIPLPEFITTQTIVIFLAFVIITFVLYKLVKAAVKATVIVIIAFSFPFIVNYLGLPLPITANIQTGLRFAILGLGLFIVYQFIHFILYFLKAITLPLRILFKRRRR
jgi:hypothetical protein